MSMMKLSSNAALSKGFDEIGHSPISGQSDLLAVAVKHREQERGIFTLPSPKETLLQEK